MWSNISTEQELKVPSMSTTLISQGFLVSLRNLVSLLGQSGFNIQSIRNTHIYIKVQKEPPNVKWFGVTILNYPASNRALTTYTPESPCISFYRLRTHPQESCDSSLVLKLWPSPKIVNNHSPHFRKESVYWEELGYVCSFLLLLKTESYFENIFNEIIPH